MHTIFPLCTICFDLLKKLNKRVSVIPYAFYPYLGRFLSKRIGLEIEKFWQRIYIVWLVLISRIMMLGKAVLLGEEEQYCAQ
ncbi:Hypothetical protein Cp106_0318 [Corynebacterium pseudotuberculosis 1/06-A]|nr:Hypothetical protein Cp106_0318 [Corynebacterium pseudotuberculosis 1/06-A]